MKEQRRCLAGVNKVWLTPRALALPLLAICFLFPIHSFGESSGNEREAILKAARDFLAAEVRQEHSAVYKCFAPSSPYARSHTYEEYLKQATASVDRVVDYNIIGVSYILDNDDYQTLPWIEKFAQVEVDVTFLHIPTQRRSKINIGFIFF